MELLKNVFMQQARFSAMMEDLGYETQTTFFQDFSIADAFGVKAVQDTYNQAFKSWKTNIVYLTELSMVLNHKIWQHYHANHEEFSKLYDKLWKEIDDYCINNLKDSDLEYYLRVTD